MFRRVPSSSISVSFYYPLLREIAQPLLCSCHQTTPGSTFADKPVSSTISNDVLNTNVPPAENNHPALLEFVSRGSARRAYLDATIAALEAELTKLFEERESLDAEVRKHEGALSPLRRMPVEIISLIFKFAAPVSLISFTDGRLPILRKLDLRISSEPDDPDDEPEADISDLFAAWTGAGKPDRATAASSAASLRRRAAVLDYLETPALQELYLLRPFQQPPLSAADIGLLLHAASIITNLFLYVPMPFAPDLLALLENPTPPADGQPATLPALDTLSLCLVPLNRTLGGPLDEDYLMRTVEAQFQRGSLRSLRLYAMRFVASAATLERMESPPRAGHADCALQELRFTLFGHGVPGFSTL
ncbi:hypothetical protein B0H14DRAFT_3879871 [Mycena olivaceomarginata]|nr:hypothetical protein B0H14DRAFT_3879871 [Mycena olivaceomarginata]